jgi:protease-4
MNEVRRRGPIARVFLALWDTLNFTRRLVFNLLFLLIVIVIIAAIVNTERAGPLAGDNTLVVAPEGRLVEQYTADPVSRALAKAFGDEQLEVQLRDILRALDHAKEDDRIERVYLRVDKLQPTGFASLREIGAALDDVRAAGKQVVAFGENFGQAQYLLAAHADEVYLDPMGGLLLEGLGRYRAYYREGLQDKLGVDVHLFKVGEYKSAAEPYVRDDASPEAKEADLFWMNDVWTRYLADVAQARGLDAARLAAEIETLPADIAAVEGDLAEYALRHGLVDGLMTEMQVEALLAERGVADEEAEGGFRQVSLDDYLAHVMPGPVATDARPQVAVVVAEGAITGGEQPPGTVGGESTSALLRDALEDEQVEAVVLRVNSPGGEVFASEQIRREVVALQEAGKPVIASMGDVAASGGYWISMDADKIYADPSTITGSIGIFGLFPTIERGLDKIGVHTDGVGTTRFAGAFDITRPLDPAVGEVIQEVIEKGYADFIGRVAEARGKTVAQVDDIARGRVWSGEQAHARGLVDAFGGVQDAIAAAAEAAGLDEGDYRVRYVEKEVTPFERFFANFVSSRMGSALVGDSDFARGVVAAMLPEQVRDELAFVQRALARNGGRPVTSVAHCFCGF